MSKGGFTGKGIFGSIPYLVVEYDDESKKTITFRYEEHVDDMLSYLNEHFPDIKTVSEAAQERLKKAEEERRKRLKKNLSDSAKSSISELNDAKKYLEDNGALCKKLAASSKAMRIINASNPVYKYIALFIVLGGIVCAALGIWMMLSKTGDFGIYFTLIGFAAIMFFSSANVFPTARINKKSVQSELESSRAEMDKYIEQYENKSGKEFPVPSRYAHPIVLERMIRNLNEGRAETTGQAYSVLKDDLKMLNSSVTVLQEEYDEVIVIKPMFLLEDYR